MLNQDERLERALKRLDNPRLAPEGYPEKALTVEELYPKVKSGEDLRPWNQWEQAAQMAAKLKVMMNEPSKHDPTGKRAKNYVRALELFDLDTGLFPDNIDLTTGAEKPKE